MPKADKSTTTPPPRPFNPTWARVLAPLIETDAHYASRGPINQAMFAVSGAADRIGGLSEICYALNLSEMQMGGQWAGERGLRHPYGFFAKTLADIAMGLREAEKLYRREMDRQDEAALAASKRGKK